MRRLTLSLFLALCLLPTLCRPAAAQEEITASAAPRADARVLRALNSGAERVRVIFALKDGTPSARALRLSPDPAGEPARRMLRLEAQKRLAEEMPREEFEVRHFYGSFSLLSANVTRAAALALANRPDVDWITIDGKKKALEPTAQVAVTLIHSDQANALGFTGAGQTVAVLDTGVDYNVTALGGAPFPNAKVIGGTDTADNDEDPLDCEGHGTSVAAIAAGPSGVAPDAKIVAVKVFPSKNATSSECDDSADDSDILAGVDWAIDHRTALGIGAINLSLGGAFEDVLDHGYCDADLPSYTSAFDSAVAMGIVVTVASGNDGTSNTLAAPACVSSAVSVGGVYPQTSSSRSWLDDVGGIQCTDAPTAPDQIICFSNSSSALSLLAPGDAWLVAAKGGGLNVFAGTSASSPAVAGAIALLRQAQPGLSPASLVGILRSTGKPITDPRNGITTPRLDTLAAVSFPADRYFPFLGTSPTIPDGSGSASASVTISGFTGGVAGLEVSVEIDHPDPQQLRLTLTGPDGTKVILHDQTGQHEHPINAIYGKLDVPAQSLGAFQGHPPNGVWTLTVEDKVQDTPSLHGRIRTFAIKIQPGQAGAAIPPNVTGRVLPVMAHSQGSKFFLSDLHILNPGTTPRTFQLFFVPNGGTGTQASKATRTIGPGQVLEINDVIAAEYGFSDSYGPIVATATNPAFVISGRLYTNTNDGSFGHSVSGFATSEGLAFGGGTATANGLIKSDEFHSNVAFTEVSGAPVQVRVDVRRRRRDDARLDEHPGAAQHDADPRRRDPGPRPLAPVQLPRQLHRHEPDRTDHPLRDLRGRPDGRLDLPAGLEPRKLRRRPDPDAVGARERREQRLLPDQRLPDQRGRADGQRHRLAHPERPDRRSGFDEGLHAGARPDARKARRAGLRVRPRRPVDRRPADPSGPSRAPRHHEQHVRSEVRRHLRLLGPGRSGLAGRRGRQDRANDRPDPVAARRRASAATSASSRSPARTPSSG